MKRLIMLIFVLVVQPTRAIIGDKISFFKKRYVFIKKSPFCLPKLNSKILQYRNESFDVVKKLMSLGIDKKEALQYRIIYFKTPKLTGVDSINKILCLEEKCFKPYGELDLDCPRNHMIMAHEAGHIQYKHAWQKFEYRHALSCAVDYNNVFRKRLVLPLFYSLCRQHEFEADRYALQRARNLEDVCALINVLKDYLKFDGYDYDNAEDREKCFKKIALIEDRHHPSVYDRIDMAYKYYQEKYTAR